MRFLSGAFIGAVVASAVLLDTNRHLRYAEPMFGIMCRMHGLSAVVSTQGSFGDANKTHCVDMTYAEDERVLWEEAKSRILNGGKGPN